MNPSPFSMCRPAVRASLDSALAKLDTDPAFERAALAICEQIFPTGTDSAVIADLATQVRSRVPSMHPKALLAHTHALLFEEMNLRLDDGDLACFLVIKVLAARRGAALVLALIYKLVLARLGFRSRGIALPGRLLVSVEIDGGNMLVDVAAGGRVISLNEALAWSRQKAASTGPARDPLPAFAHSSWLGELADRLAELLTIQGRAADVDAMREISKGIREARPAAKEPSSPREKFTDEGGPSKSSSAGTDNLETDNLEEGR